MKGEFIWANLVHLSENISTTDHFCDPLSCEDAAWRELTDHMVRQGLNMIVIDLNDGVRYESHPEIAVKGAWSVEKLRKELVRLRSVGLEPIPKLNFSACHDIWFGKYAGMVSTDKYYRVCEDLIREVGEIFDTPRFFHIGFDEEDVTCQEDDEYMIVRQGDLWWHDLYHLVGTVEKAGMRAWMWSDHVWDHPDRFYERMPKSVVQSNWYYDAGFTPLAFRWPRIRVYLDLDRYGFDQIPTASNFVYDRNMQETVEFCDAKLSKEHLKGYLATSWRTTTAKNRALNFSVVDSMADCIRKGGKRS